MLFAYSMSNAAHRTLAVGQSLNRTDYLLTMARLRVPDVFSADAGNAC
jgi:hypothetical protein